MSEKVLVLQAGRLINGTGRPPLDDAVAVSRDGRVPSSRITQRISWLRLGAGRCLKWVNYDTSATWTPMSA
jgi:hypothetical protein